MAITGKAESVSEYSETRIDVRVKKVLTSYVFGSRVVRQFGTSVRGAGHVVRGA